MTAMTALAAPTVIVTGAAGGIGRSMVSVFDEAGWRVVSTDKEAIERPLHVIGDLAACADPDGPEGARIVAELRAAAAGGSLQALIHNGAHQVIKGITHLTPTDWRTSLDVNLLAPFWLTIAFLPELEANHGCMVAISSIHERLTKPGFVAYSTSKAALSAMVRAMAVDHGSRVRFNAICPAAIGTPMLHAGFADRPDALQALERFHPAGRIGDPDEIAQTALFLCSDKAKFINGACIDVSGGIGARLHDPG